MPALAPKIKFKPLVRKPAKKDKPFFAPIGKRKVEKKVAKKLVISDKKFALKKVAEKKYAVSPKNKKLVELKKKIDKAASKNKQHEPTAKKVDETKKAVHVNPALEKSSQAQSKQVDEMSNQKPKKFDANKFATDILINIRRVIPSSEQEMENDGTSSAKMAAAQQTMSNTLEDEKTNSGGELGGAVASTPDISNIPTKEVTPLKPEIPQTSNSIKGAAISPDLKKPSETSLQKESSQIDDKMKVSNVSELQLAKSNEPAFQTAVSEKKKSQEKAKGTHQEYLLVAKPIAQNVEKQTALQTTMSVAKAGQKKKAGFSQVERKKAEQKAKEELLRTKIAQDLDRIYNATKTKVEARLENLNTKVNEMFDEALSQANTTFENNVRRRTETSFWDDLVSWASGIPRETEIVFKEEQELFINSLRPVVFKIGTFVERELNAAMKEIERDKEQVAKYWSSLDKDAKKIGADLYESVNGRFNELETSVEDASESLKESITTKFNEAIANLEETYNKIKEENKSWLEKAYEAVVGVINAIIDMKNLLLNILSKAANAIEAIISDPIGFLSNLLRAIKLGFTRFGENILVHLKEGFIAWLMGNMPPSIQFPQTWDLKGIFLFVMSVLGLTWQNIRSRAERMFGATVVTALETGFDIFMIVKNEGLAGLWRYIQDQIGNLKTMVLDAIQNMLIEKVVKAGITWVISLFNPAGAFIKACKLIYDVVSWFINNARRLLDLVNSIVDSVTLIVAGQIDSAATFVENSLKRAIPIVIGFLAGLLGIGDLSAKIQAILNKIQAPINKAIDWVLKKAGDFVKRIGRAIASGARRVFSLLGLRKRIRTNSGETHTLYFAGVEDNETLMIASSPKTFDSFLNGLGTIQGDKKVAKDKASCEFQLLVSALRVRNTNPRTSDQYQVAQNEKYEKVTTHVNNLGNYVPPLFDMEGVGEFKLEFGGLQDGFGTSMQVSNLHKTNKPPIGSVPGVTNVNYNRLKKKRNGGSAYYILGHLLNHNLGGSGRDFRNLTPITRSANALMSSKIEEKAKADLEKGLIINYKVTPIYGGNIVNNKPTNLDVPNKKVIVETEEKTPKEIKYEYEAFKLENNEKKSMNKILADTIQNTLDFNHGTYMDTEE